MKSLQNGNTDAEKEHGNEPLPASVDELCALVIEQQRQLEQQSLFIDQLLEQIRLAFNEAEAAMSDDDHVAGDDRHDSVVVPEHRRKTGGRRRLPKTFPRAEVVYELDQANCQCGTCQQTLTPVSEKVSEQLDIQPATVRVIRHVRKTYAYQACDGAMTTAPSRYSRFHGVWHLRERWHTSRSASALMACRCIGRRKNSSVSASICPDRRSPGGW